VIFFFLNFFYINFSFNLCICYFVLNVNVCFCFRGDTTLILATCAGLLTGGWLNVKLGIQDDIRVMNPINNSVSWPSINYLGKYLYY